MKNKLFFWLKTYLGFSKRESQGFVLLLPILIILYAIPKVYHHTIRLGFDTEYHAYQSTIDSLVREGYEKVIKSSTLAKLDSPQKKTYATRPKGTALNKLDFNEADSIVLQVVPGIGQTMAGRIVKFREGLGGMIDKEQLLDVYGMTPEVADRVFEYFDFTPGIYKKIQINQADASTLANHPYITYGAAKVLTAYRTQHGAYSTAEDLLKVRIFTEEWVDKIKPYLDFN